MQVFLKLCPVAPCVPIYPIRTGRTAPVVLPTRSIGQNEGRKERTNEPASQPASQPASKPASQQASKQASNAKQAQTNKHKHSHTHEPLLQTSVRYMMPPPKRPASTAPIEELKIRQAGDWRWLALLLSSVHQPTWGTLLCFNPTCVLGPQKKAKVEVNGIGSRLEKGSRLACIGLALSGSHNCRG